MYFLCFGVDRLFVYGDLFKSSVWIQSHPSRGCRESCLCLVLHMCFGIDLSTRVTTNKARGTFLSEGYRCDFSWSGLGSPFLIRMILNLLLLNNPGSPTTETGESRLNKKEQGRADGNTIKKWER